MTRSRQPSLSLLTACLAVAGIVAACGGSDSTPTTVVSGSVVKGPVSGATICAYKAVITGKGEQIKCATTSTTGSYVMEVQYVGDIVIEAVGGTYTDEATNTTRTLAEFVRMPPYWASRTCTAASKRRLTARVRYPAACASRALPSLSPRASPRSARACTRASRPPARAAGPSCPVAGTLQSGTSF